MHAHIRVDYKKEVEKEFIFLKMEHTVGFPHKIGKRRYRIYNVLIWKQNWILLSIKTINTKNI